MLVLGDHQPATIVSGTGADHDVPVTIVARDPAVVAAVSNTPALLRWAWIADALASVPGVEVLGLVGDHRRALSRFERIQERAVENDSTRMTGESRHRDCSACDD